MANILLVDDSQTVAKVVSLVLEKQSHKVFVCSSTDTLVEKLSEAVYDLVIFDFGMFEEKFVGKIKTPLIITYNSYDDVATDTKLSKISARLIKPFTSQQLLDTVERAIKENNQASKSWSMDSFEDPEISKIIKRDLEASDIKEKKLEEKKENLETKVDEKVSDKTEDQEEKTEVTDIVSKTLTDNLLNDIYGFEEQSEVKSLDEQDPILKDIDDGELSKEEQVKLLEEYKMEKSNDGTIEFKAETLEKQAAEDEKLEVLESDNTTDTPEPTEDDLKQDLEAKVSSDESLNEDLDDINVSDATSMPSSDGEEHARKESMMFDKATLREEFRSVLREVLPDIIADVLKSQDTIDSVKKIAMETAEHLVKEEINKIASVE